MTDNENPTPAQAASEGATTQTPELLAFADCELVAINAAMMLVINRDNGNQQVMTRSVVEGLRTCTEFSTLETHATFLANTRAELKGNTAMVASALGNLNAAGMLLKARNVCDRLALPAPRQLPPSRAFIITCDRPAAVERLLESMLHNGKLAQHNALFLIDDSRDPANCEANREAVVRFNLRSAREMFYVGPEAQQALLSGLTDSLPAHAEGIRFLLDRSQWEGKKTYGRSRTLCLLLSVGYRALVMDDDILCQAILSPIREDGIGISNGGRKTAYFANERDLLSSGELADFDPLSGHASLLGSTLGHALQTLNNGALGEHQLQGVNAALVNDLQADSPILVTQCGSLGDPGTGGAHSSLYQDEDSVARLLQAPMGMTTAIENRLHWLGSSRPSFFKMPFMSQLTGLDNSRLLPPYFPAFRGEDSLFGAMLVALHRHSMSLEYAWSVPHLPLEARKISIDEPIAAGGGISLLGRQLTQNLDYRDATDPEHNLQCLAQEALRLASRSDGDLLLDYRSELARGQADMLHILENQLARAEKLGSQQWLDYVKRAIDEVQQSLATRQSLTGIRGIPEGSTEQSLLTDFKWMARGFGAALSGWVEMRRVAADLTDELISSRKILPL